MAPPGYLGLLLAVVWARFPLLSPQQGGRRAGPCLLLQGLSALFPRAAQPRGHTLQWACVPALNHFC